MDCSRRRVLACIACASDRCDAIDTLCRNHMHNKLMGHGPAHSLDANVAHSPKKRSDLKHNASYVSRANSSFRPNYAIPTVDFLPLLRSCGSDDILSSGTLHQITMGRVCNNNVDQSVPHRSIQNHNIYTPSAPPRSR